MQGEKRQEILEAASRSFVRDGLRGASISTICTEAGISPGHLYHYFDSKEAILEAIAEAYLAKAEEQLGNLADTTSVVSAVIAEIERTVRLSATGKQVLLFELAAEASRNPRMAEILQKSTKHKRSLLADLIRKGQARGEVDAALDPTMAAFVVINVIDAAKMTRTRDANVAIKKSIDMLSTLITRFLTGSSAEKPRPRRRTP